MSDIDLMRAFNFDEQDLKANRQYKFSSKQRKLLWSNMYKAWLFLHLALIPANIIKRV